MAAKGTPLTYSHLPGVREFSATLSWEKPLTKKITTMMCLISLSFHGIWCTGEAHAMIGDTAGHVQIAVLYRGKEQRPMRNRENRDKEAAGSLSSCTAGKGFAGCNLCSVSCLDLSFFPNPLPSLHDA